MTDACGELLSPPTDLARLLTETRPRLIRLAVKMVWNRDDAEEIVQEAFRLALRDRPGSSHDSTTAVVLTSWLWRTVTNLCLNHRRRRRPELDNAALATAHARTPHNTLVATEELGRLRDAIETLPDQQRVALVLKTMEQMEYPRIAQIMQITESAVRAHVHQARQKLMRLLGGDGNES